MDNTSFPVHGGMQGSKEEIPLIRNQQQCDHYESCQDIQLLNRKLSDELTASQVVLEQIVEVLRVYGIKGSPEPENIHSALSLLQQELNKRVETEMRLRDTIKTMNTVFDIIHDALCGINSNGIITNWNAAAERLAGWERKDAVGTSYNSIFPQVDISSMSKSTSASWLQDIQEKKAAEELSSYQTTLQHRNGSLLRVNMIKAVLRSTMGVWNILCFSRI